MDNHRNEDANANIDSKFSSFSYNEILAATQRATEDYEFCPNRVWLLVESLPGKDQTLPIFFPPHEDSLSRLLESRKYSPLYNASHAECAADFCQLSSVDFTSVQRRHEGGPHCNAEMRCESVKDRFPRQILREAALQQKPTAWKLSGRMTVGFHVGGDSRYWENDKIMALSHVWSDGTGVGAWSEGINQCLLDLFWGLARRLGCSAIWWDSLSIPQEKSARIEAIKGMHWNYRNAEVTLVHDCFLRSLDWAVSGFDAELACLAIVLSPWFSRGWTALELACSKQVKVLFSSDGNPMLKDLDQDLLADPVTPRHKLLVRIIKGLRLRDIELTAVTQLLEILKPRHTSWPKDRPIIAMGLVEAARMTKLGIGEQWIELLKEEKDYLSAATAKLPAPNSQWKINQHILRQMERIGTDQLFHNLPTRKDSWCPSDLLSMPLSVRPSSLLVDEAGNIIGRWWFVRPAVAIENGLDWSKPHPATKARLQHVLAESDTSVLCLIEPQSVRTSRLLVVRVVEQVEEMTVCQYIGPIYLAQAVRRMQHGVAEMKILFAPEPQSGRTQGQERSLRPIVNSPCSTSLLFSSSKLPSPQGQFQESEQFEHQRSRRNQNLAQAEELDDFLAAYLDCLDARTSTVLQNLMKRRKESVLISIQIWCQERNMQSPLIWATRERNIKALEFLVAWVETDIDASWNDDQGRVCTALWIAIDLKCLVICRLLLEAGANPDVFHGAHRRFQRGLQDQMNSLLSHAILIDFDEGVNLLLHANADVDFALLCPHGANLHHEMRTPLWAASITQRRRFVRLLLAKDACTSTRDSVGRTLIFYAIDLHGPILHRLETYLLVADMVHAGFDIDATDDMGITPMLAAIDKGDITTIRILHFLGAKLNTVAKGSRDTPLGHAILVFNAAVLVNTLLKMGADPNLRTKRLYRQGPLHLLCGHRFDGGKALLARILLDAGADPNGRDTQDWTPLHLALKGSLDLELIKALLEGGADPSLKDESGRTPLSMIEEWKRRRASSSEQHGQEVTWDEMIEMFKSHSAENLPTRSRTEAR